MTNELVALRAELKETRRIRDEWCYEYTAMRNKLIRIARVAQPVERLVEGQGVGGSIPSSGTNALPTRRQRPSNE